MDVRGQHRDEVKLRDGRRIDSKAIVFFWHREEWFVDESSCIPAFVPSRFSQEVKAVRHPPPAPPAEIFVSTSRSGPCGELGPQNHLMTLRHRLSSPPV
ncbi:hypothetical protein SAMN05216386_1423 [Nitrosospira briensis]|uniref:Uncharacterized protein n=1 Tax=Nitrosospira briensis TaxID=35799 RepID=A0A1I5AJM6_9PROT|nr:hypothetical protein SAMN05216386_1423 [Nitrosospira briensis]